MLRRFSTVFLVLICLFPFFAANAYESQKQAIAVPAIGEIKIDGLANETFWAQAPLAPGDFWSREDGSKMTVKTDVKAAYDELNLYVYVYAYDTDPITMAETVKDGFDIFQYDCIAVAVFMSGAQGNWFAVEPKGGKVFYIGSGSGANPDLEIGTQVTPGHGWSAEFRIAWSTVDLPLSGETEIGFGVDRRKQNPSWQWGDWCYIGREENSANTGTLKVVLSKRPIDASLTLEGTVKHNFDAKEEEKATKTHGTATLFVNSQSLRGTFSAYPYDEDIARDIASVAYSYFDWKYGEWRNLLLENNSTFTRNQPGYYSLWGYSLFHSPTVGSIKAGTNVVYKHRLATLGAIGTLNEEEENNLVLRGLSGIGSNNFGGHFMVRSIEGENEAVGSIDLMHKGKGYNVVNETAYTGSGIKGLREEGKLAFFFKRWEPSIAWLLKGEDHYHPFAYDPMPGVYGIYPAVDKKFIWTKGLIKEFSTSLWSDYFRYWREDKSFYTSLGFWLWFETQPLLGLNHVLYFGAEKSSYAEWDEDDVYQRNRDKVFFTRYLYNFRGENKFNIYYRCGEVANHEIDTIKFWGKLNAGLFVKNLKNLTGDLSLEHERHWSKKNQAILSLNYSIVDQCGIAARYVWREIDGERKINNFYIAGWLAWREILEVHTRFGLPNEKKFVPDIGLKIVGKLPLSDWWRH